MRISQSMKMPLSIIILLSACTISQAWSDKTHKAISEKAIIYSQVDAYLKNELSLNQGLGTTLLLDQSVIPVPERIPTAQFETRITPELPSNPCTILDFLKAGASLEDIPTPRARHHFHSPIANPGVTPPNPNSGLDNRTDHPYLAETFDLATQIIYTLHFNLTGTSAEKRAMGIEGLEWETEYQNYFAWPDTRTYFYRALTKSNLSQRNHYLALTFISLGQTAHLLEDMGVPAHTRNDFVEGHMRLRGWKVFKDWGNPLEHWAEKQVKANNNNIPSSWLTGWTPQAKVFDKISKYWDADLYDGDYVGPNPYATWGLAERTNYQFLSTSTVFGCEGTLYQFPQPAESYTTLTSEQKIGENKYLRYYQGYGLQHLARQTYSNYVAHGYSPYAVTITKKTITPDDDINVYNDYVRATIPRTIDYTTGLLNYFFRGRLAVEPNCASPDCNQIEVYITNNSNNSGVPQTLKGGSFELYWDDEEGTRSQVTGFTIPGWNVGSTLAFGQSATGQFTRPTPSQGHQINKYILVYKGQINANPAEPDPNDPNAVAIDIFEPPVPLPYIKNITPEMGHPDSVLLVEGSGFSATPAENTVSFEDVSNVYPDVYGTVLDADSNGAWLTVELPYFDACDVDYYWAHTQVAVDGNVSNIYDLKLTNYIWCTIKLWDGGEVVDDEFDLYINNEYFATSYMDPPENPTVVNYGFWYADEYHFVDTYLYDSYEISGGTLGISVEPYVERVVAYRWNETTQQQEFLYDNPYNGMFSDYFGSDLLKVQYDGIELDVYPSLTYTGMEQTQSETQTLGIIEESAADDSAFMREARGKAGSIDTIQGIYEPAKVHKEVRKKMGSSSRISTRNRIRRVDGR